jgi:hypothetical protein
MQLWKSRGQPQSCIVIPEPIVLTDGNAWKTGLSQRCQTSATGQNFLALVLSARINYRPFMRKLQRRRVPQRVHRFSHRARKFCRSDSVLGLQADYPQIGRQATDHTYCNNTGSRIMSKSYTGSWGAGTCRGAWRAAGMSTNTSGHRLEPSTEAVSDKWRSSAPRVRSPRPCRRSAVWGDRACVTSPRPASSDSPAGI